MDLRRPGGIIVWVCHPHTGEAFIGVVVVEIIEKLESNGPQMNHAFIRVILTIEIESVGKKRKKELTIPQHWKNKYPW